MILNSSRGGIIHHWPLMVCGGKVPGFIQSEEPDRKNPWVFSAVFLYHLFTGLNFQIGLDIELEEAHDLITQRGGIVFESNRF